MQIACAGAARSADGRGPPAVPSRTRRVRACSALARRPASSAAAAARNVRLENVDGRMRTQYMISVSLRGSVMRTARHLRTVMLLVLGVALAAPAGVATQRDANVV